MRPALLNPLFAPVTSLSGVGPKQDRLLRYLLDRDETPRLVDLLLHLPASVIDRRARPKIRDAVPGTMVTLEVTVDRHRVADFRPRPAIDHTGRQMQQEIDQPRRLIAAEQVAKQFVLLRPHAGKAGDRRKQRIKQSRAH